MDIKKEIKKIPPKPGVYFFQDKKGKIIYIGKANNLRLRISSHFSQKHSDYFNDKKIKDTSKIKYLETSSEVEALFLESEFIKRYKPKYNIEWKDEKNFLYVKLRKLPVPEIQLVRNPFKEPKTIFYGPYTNSKALRNVLKILSRILPIKYLSKNKFSHNYLWHNKVIKEIISQKDLLRRINLFFKGKIKNLLKEFEKEMKEAAKLKNFEKAALYRDRIKSLIHIKEVSIFQEILKERRIEEDIALREIQDKLELVNFPYLIEAFDISNISGKEAVGSLVCFKNGIPEKSNYRRYKIKTIKGINDYGMIKEILEKRFKKENYLPQLVLIDGGKGHLSIALKVMKDMNLNIEVAAIAKKREEIYIKSKKNNFKKIILKKDSPALLLIKRIRDEAHRFAITYHRLLMTKRGRFSYLDNIPGIGQKRKAELIKKFKTIENIKKASFEELKAIVGEKLAKKIKKFSYFI